MDFTTGAWWVAICFGILAALVCFVGWWDEYRKRQEAQPLTNDAPRCKVCDHPLTWVDCWWCGEDDDDCSVCGMDDGWYECWNCYPDLADDKEPEHERTSAGVDRERSRGNGRQPPA